MMQIIIKDLTFETIIGILEEERLSPQKVILHVKINYNYSQKNFIDYAQIAFYLEEQMKKEAYFLIEDALEDLSQKLLHLYPQILTLKIKIYKPSILPNAIVGVARKVSRNKN